LILRASIAPQAKNPAGKDSKLRVRGALIAATTCRRIVTRSHVERGRVMCGSNWYRQGVGAARMHALDDPTDGID
jgi:hypothetical protein